MKTVDIKGKAYIEVNERLKHFRENYPDHKLVSEIISNINGVCIMIARVIDGTGAVIATGHAYEKEGSTFINKTSYIENCETSAWGRALGNFGIGIDTAVASAEEVQNAIANQGNTVPINEKQFNNLTSLIDSIDPENFDYDKFLKWGGVDDLERFPAEKYNQAVELLEKKAAS